MLQKLKLPTLVMFPVEFQVVFLILMDLITLIVLTVLTVLTAPIVLTSALQMRKMPILVAYRAAYRVVYLAESRILMVLTVLTVLTPLTAHMVLTSVPQ